jgi:high affinity Mn2+ porin
MIWLIYATGGFAWSQARFIESPGFASDVDKTLTTRTGWTAGVGAELAVAPDWTARLEYLYDRFGSATANFPSGTGYLSAFDLHMLRLGLNYKIGLAGGDSPIIKGPGADPWPIASDNWNVHGQFTFVGQGYPPFHSPYEGAQSLSGASQFQNTTSATAFVGIRPWEGGEIYIDPELMQGFGLSDTFGLAGFPNGEAQKSNFHFYGDTGLMPRVLRGVIHLLPGHR